MEALQRETLALASRVKALEESASSHTTHDSPSTSTVGDTGTATAARLGPPGPAARKPSKDTVLSASGLGRILNPPKSPPYVGPTSSEFGLSESARRHREELRNGSGQGSGEVDDTGASEEEGEPLRKSDNGSNSIDQVQSGDPLISMGLEEALRLIGVYEDAVGIMYPCVDLESVRDYAKVFYDAGSMGMHPKRLSTAHSTSDNDEQDDQDWFYARDIQVLKLILAIALLAESHGRSEGAAMLADSVEDKFAGRLKIAKIDMKETLILALLVSSHV